jgi:hypothetical protein
MIMRASHLRIWRTILWEFILSFVGIYTFAQAPTGTLAGRVVDPTGAAIPGVHIVITNQRTGVKRELLTAANGDYNAAALFPGNYEVAAEADQFQRVTRAATIETGTTTTLDFSLPIGPASETITVGAASPQIQYDTHQVSGVVTLDQVEALPLNGRSFLELAKLEPGAQAPTRASSNRLLVPVLGAPAGQNGRATRITVDGGSIMEVGSGGSAMGFSQEVIQEFQVSSVNLDLSTGVTGSGAINMVTRSGSNDLHGSAFLFFRDHTLAAYPALKRDALNPNPFFQRRQFGFAAGGPLRKERAFWFGTFERNEQRGVISTEPVTPEFAPLMRITKNPTYGNQFSARLDWRVSDRHFAFLRHSHDGSFSYGPVTFTAAGPGAREYPSAWTRQLSWADQTLLGITSQFTSNVVNDLRFSYFFVSSGDRVPRPQDCPGCLGLGSPSISVRPDLFIGRSELLTVLGRRFHLNDVVSWHSGRHRLRLGGDWEVTRGGLTDLANEPVTMTLFSPRAVRHFNVIAPRPIPLPASFLTLQNILQLPLQSFTVGIGDPHVPQADFGRTRVAPLVHVFAHDTWQRRSRLTLNYGLGWNFDGSLNYDLRKPAYLLPLLGARGLDPTRQNWTNFSPSIGFAWSPSNSGKTVIRGGAGIYYDFRVSSADSERVSLGPRGVGRSDYDGSGIPNPLDNVGVPKGMLLNFANPSLFTGADLLQALPIIRAQLQQQRGDPANRDFSVTNIEADKQGSLVASDLPAGSSLQASIGIQRQLMHDFVLSADFVTRRFRHFGTGVSGIDYNRFLPTGGVLPLCSAAQRNDPKALCSLGPISVFTAIGSARYQGLLLRAEKRFSRHWQFLGSYAWSSNVGNSFGSGFDNINWLANYGPLDRDIRHILNLSGVVELPKSFQLAWTTTYTSKPPFSAFLGGIDLNGDGTTDDLLPGTKVNQFNRGLDKPDLLRLVAAFNANYAGKTDAQGQAIPAIVLPADFQFGDAFLTHDLRLSRDCRISERYHLILIGEVFNVFNIANLSGRSGDLLSPGFGQATHRVDQVFGSGGPRSFQLAARVTF